MPFVTVGAASYTDYVYIQQDASATNPGEPKTGLLFSDIETGGSASYMRQGAVRQDFELFTQTVAGAYTVGGFVEVDATNMPGVYRLDVPNAALASGADFVIIQLVVASANNAVANPLKIDLLAMDLRDAVRGGLSSLPDAAAEAAGGLYTRGSGAGQIAQQTAGQIDVSVERWRNIVQNILVGGRVDATLDATGMEAGAVTALVDGTWDELKSGHTTPDTFGDYLDDEITSRLAPTTPGRNLDVAVTGEAGIDFDNIKGLLSASFMANDVIGASELSAAAVVKIGAAVWDALKSAHLIADSFGDYLDTEISSRSSHGDPDPSNFIDAAISTRATPTQVAAELVTIHLDHLFAADYDPASIPGVSGALLNELIEDDGDGVVRYTAKALETAPASGAGFVRALYKFSTTTGAADPGPGIVRFNNVTPASVTAVYLDTLTENNFNADQFLADLRSGDTFIVAQGDNGANFIRCTVNGAPTDNTGWWTIPVTIVDSGTLPGNNKSLNVLLGYAAALTTPQEIRDAMKLAPTGGAPAAGSVDEHLDDAGLETTLANIQGRIPASLVGGRIDASVGAMASAVIQAATFAAAAIDAGALGTTAVNEIRDSILSDATPFAGANLDALISANATPAEVLTQINAALDASISELTQGVPSATPSLRNGLMLLYMALRNRFEVDTTATDEMTIRNNAETVVAKKLVTDDGTIYSEAEMISGP